MSLRFRKSINLLPDVRMNLTGSGLSWTVGPRGFSMNVGKRGTYLNAGLPGTGLYSRTKLTVVAAGPSPPHILWQAWQDCMPLSNRLSLGRSERWGSWQATQ